jgi:hypothetical protein
LQATIPAVPNPSNGHFYITIGDSPFAKNCKVEIYNILGEKIYQAAITYPKSDIDISNQPNGTYFVKIYYGQAIRTEKIVIH